MNSVCLKVNNRINPVGIDGKLLKFSWQLKGEKQKTYRVFVFADKEDAVVQKNPVWDSGEICSNKTEAFFGGELQSLTRYYWIVSVNGERSEIAFFETAYLNAKEEMKAYWIGQPLAFAGAVDDYRIDVQIDKPIKMARLYIAMLGTGKVYVNGSLLDDVYFDGGLSVYQKKIYYRTYELPFVEGNNALCLRVGYGFYGAKKIYGVLRVVFEDGSVYEMPTIPGRIWNVKKDVVTMNCIYDGETQDARLKEDWLNPSYKITYGNWVAAFAVDLPAGELVANPIPPMRVVDTFSPKSIECTEQGYLVDAGVNLCGFLSFKVKGNRGDTIEVTHAERLTEDGRLNNVNFRAAESKDTYILKGEGEEYFCPEFTYHGFRYALVKTTGNVEICEIKACYLRSDVSLVGRFECSDSTLNALHKIAVQTEGNNLNGVFTDCPQRDERLGWLNDLSSRLYQTVNNYSMENYMANFLNMVGQSQAEDGTISDTVPYTIGCFVADPISAFTIMGELLLKYYNDVESIKRNYSAFARWMNYLKKNADENGGVVSYGYYGDWCPAEPYANGTLSKSVEINYVSAISFLSYLKHMENFAEVCGYGEDADNYAKLYLHYKERFDAKYYNAETELYGNASMTELSMATTVFTEDKKLCRKWMENVNCDVIKEGYHMTCGNVGYKHLIFNLAEYGYSDTVIKLLTNREYPGWGYMLENGATSVWERWELSVGGDMISFNHPMFSAYDAFFYNYLLGIRADLSQEGFKKIVIKPCFTRLLQFCKGGIDTLRGRIGVEWQRLEEGITVTLDIPFGTVAEVVLEGKEVVTNGGCFKDAVTIEGGRHTLCVK